MAATAVAIATSGGCSFAFVSGPPSDHASRRYFDCTSSYLAPGIDLTLGGLLGLGMIESTSDNSSDRQGTIGATLIAAGTLASAAYGFLHASHCRDAKQALAERLLEPPRMMAPPPGMAFPPAGGAATATGAPMPAPPNRDPWLSEGMPPGGGWGAPPPPPPAANAGDAGAPNR